MCRNAAPSNPYSKDAACPSLSTRATEFDLVFKPEGLRGRYYVRVCDYLTFIGSSTSPNGMNPVLDNEYELTGALVSTFNAETETYLDARMVDADTANPHAQVRCCSCPSMWQSLACAAPVAVT